MTTMKRTFPLFIAIFTLVMSMLSFIPSHVHAVAQMPTSGVYVNGKAVNGLNTVRIGNKYFVPVTPMAKTLGYNHITFEQRTSTFEMTDGSTTIRTTVGGTRARRGNEFINIDAPRWINGVAYTSMSATSALFNSFIYFEPKNGSVQIEKPASKYYVQRGDSLWSIATAHHTSVNALKAANNIISNTINSGEILIIPNRQLVKEIEPIREKKPVKKPAEMNVATMRNNIINEALKYRGAGYKFGATLNEAPLLFDCSSFTQFVFQNNGIALPRVSRDQAGIGNWTQNLQKGDLLFFTNNDLYSDGRVGHVGIYDGNGNMIHASSSRGVHITSDVFNNPYWKRNYLFSKKVLE